MSDAKIERMRPGYQSFEQGDLDGIRDLFAADVVWHVPGDMHQDVHDVLASDSHGVAITHVRASRPDGRNLDINRWRSFTPTIRTE